MTLLAATDIPRAFFWKGDHLALLDQTMLPTQQIWLPLFNLEDVSEAIRMLRVRGAPAIGVAGAYGAVLEIRLRSRSENLDQGPEWLKHLLEITEALRQTRPTAVNLFHCMDRMDRVARDIVSESGQAAFDSFAAGDRMEAEALAIHREDEEICNRMGSHGAELIADGVSILTHCNTGAVATGGLGTALGAIYTAHLSGKKIQVYADETRPLLQGGRITAWELFEAGIPVKLITDSMAASVMADGKIDLIMVGADRIAANGDTANKIGTLNLGILAKHFGIPMYIVAPTTTLDPSLASGQEIVIEERKADEVRQFQGQYSAPPEVDVFNPAFDVTPGELITGIVTELGVHRPPYDFRSVMAGKS